MYAHDNNDNLLCSLPTRVWTASKGKTAETLAQSQGSPVFRRFADYKSAIHSSNNMKTSPPAERGARNVRPLRRRWLAMAALFVSLAIPARALQAPDLTVGTTRLTVYTNSQYYIGGKFFTYNLGPTGLRGWIYALGDGTLDQFTSVAPWQILVTSVGANTPAAGILQTNDVISGRRQGCRRFLIHERSRMVLGNAITAAEAGNGQLSLLVHPLRLRQQYECDPPVGHREPGLTAPPRPTTAPNRPCCCPMP